MKTSVKWYLRLLWQPQQRLPCHITTTTTTTSTITSTGIRIMGTMSFQRISNQKQHRLGSIPLLEAFIATISSRTTKDRATPRTEICQPEVKIYNFRSHKRSSDERAV
uniref:Secreted protein n=1 Tax=Ursus americanus TaxID=9643 RepID=A0A452R855_URSAM